MSYLVVKTAANATPESYQLTNNIAAPRMAISGSYIPITTDSGNGLKVDDGSSTYRLLKTTIVSNSRSASATFLTSGVNSAGMSNITSLTQAVTTATLTRAETTATLTRASTSGTNYGTKGVQYITYAIHLNANSNGWQYRLVSASYVPDLNQTIGTTYQTRYRYFSMTANFNGIYWTSNGPSPYTGGPDNNIVFNGNYGIYSSTYITTNQIQTTGTSYLTCSSVSGYATRSSISGYGTSEATIGYSGISSSSSSESASTTSWI